VSSTPRDRRIDAVLWLFSAAALWLTVWLSFSGTPPDSEDLPGIDKVEHALAYFVTGLAVLLAGVWRPGRGRGPLWPARWWIILTALAGGALIEVLQATMTTDRNGDVWDWVAELVGVGFAVLAVGLLRRRAEA
jgi:VanZ family protein